MADASLEATRLTTSQNSDGGWGYALPSPDSLKVQFQKQTSWTEPTALAVLALVSIPSPGDASVANAAERGRNWLRVHQRADGGWAPHPSVEQSTSVTAPACLALGRECEPHLRERAIRWLLSQVKPPLTLTQKFAFWRDGMPTNEMVTGGCPWYPGTASWIAPTVATTLAFKQAAPDLPWLDLEPYITQAQHYILSRRCQQGGWDHGGTHFLSPQANPYPETTGLALLALDAKREQDISADIARAEQMYATPGSCEAQSWLHLGLTKHLRAAALSAVVAPPHTVRDLALRILAGNAASHSNRFITQPI